MSKKCRAQYFSEAAMSHNDVVMPQLRTAPWSESRFRGTNRGEHWESPTPAVTSHHFAAAVGLPRLLIEHLTGQAQVCTLVYQVFQLLPSLQHAFDGFVQHHLRLIQVALDLGQFVRLGRILQARSPSLPPSVISFRYPTDQLQIPHGPNHNRPPPSLSLSGQK
jgi:hypothetical protein